MNNQPKADQSKTGRNLIIVGVLLIIGILIGVGSIYIVKVGLPYLRHENMLKTNPDLMCLTLSISHGCHSEDYNEKELEKYLKEKVLTLISIDEAEEIVKKTKESIIQERKKDKNWNVDIHKKNLAKQKKKCDDWKQKAMLNTKSNSRIIKGFTCHGSSGLGIVVYLDKTLRVLQEIEKEQ